MLSLVLSVVDVVSCGLRMVLGSGSYEEMRRLMGGLVPWNDMGAHKIHAIITNICPELLMPGAVIDVKNMLLLDQRIDFVSPASERRRREEQQAARAEAASRRLPRALVSVARIVRAHRACWRP